MFPPLPGRFPNRGALFSPDMAEKKMFRSLGDRDSSSFVEKGDIAEG